MTWINFPSAQQGWECPKCGRVYSPSTTMCLYCPTQTTTTKIDTSSPSALAGWNIKVTSTQGCPSCGKYSWELGAASCPDGFHYGA